MWRQLSFILLISILFSCSTRITSASKINQRTNIDSVIEEKKDSTSIQQNAVIIKENIEEIELVPIDTSKPITIDGKQYLNVTVKIRNTNRKIVDSTKTILSKSEEKQSKVSKKEKVEGSVKTVNKKTSYFNFWWLLLIPIGVLVVRRYLIK